MAITDIINTSWGPFTHAEVEAALKEKIQEMDAAIRAAAASGAVPPDEEMDGGSENAVQNRVVKAYIDVAVSLLETAITAKYTKPAGGIPAGDLAPGVIPVPDSALGDTDNTVKNRAVKAAIDNLRAILDTITEDGNVVNAIDTFNEVKSFLEGISNEDTLADKLAQLVVSINAKQDALTSSNTLMTINNEPVHYGESVTIEAEDGEDGVGFESVETPQVPNGTVNITLTNGDSITLDLNHSHPNMAKIVACVAADLPATLSLDTIYVVVDDDEDPTAIEALYLFGLEFNPSSSQTT